MWTQSGEGGAWCGWLAWFAAGAAVAGRVFCSWTVTLSLLEGALLRRGRQWKRRILVRLKEVLVDRGRLLQRS